jgi:hypothetical protein
MLALLACHSAPQPTGDGGVALGLFASDPLYDYGTLLDEIDALGAPGTLVVVPWSVADVTDATLVPRVPRPQVRRALRRARSTGAQVAVMPIVQLASPDGSWRGELAPDDLAHFWLNYDTLLLQLARDAEAVGATRLVVGSELASLEDDPSWRPRVAAVREVFSGTLTYSANWDRYAEVPFWDALDEVGVSAWWSRADRAAGLTAAERFAASRQRPLVVTEVGFAPLASAATRPWDHASPSPLDLDLQAVLLEETLADLARRELPFYVWNWFGRGGPDEISYSPRGRPAEEVVRCAFTPTDRGCER